jgi:hypothetical protein
LHLRGDKELIRNLRSAQVGDVILAPASPQPAPPQQASAAADAAQHA